MEETCREFSESVFCRLLNVYASIYTFSASTDSGNVSIYIKERESEAECRKETNIYFSVEYIFSQLSQRIAYLKR